MALQGTIIGYNLLGREAQVEIPGRGLVRAINALPIGRTPTPSLVNGYLESHEIDTVMPSHNFSVGDSVSVAIGSGGAYFLLGLVTGVEAAAPVVVPQQLEPGRTEITKSLVTDGSGLAVLEDVGERVQIRSIKITPPHSSAYHVLLKSGSGELQASWGDGDVVLSGELLDAAGFFFESDDHSARFEFSIPGTYVLELTGERFA